MLRVENVKVYDLGIGHSVPQLDAAWHEKKDSFFNLTRKY